MRSQLEKDMNDLLMRMAGVFILFCIIQKCTVMDEKVLTVMKDTR